MSYTYVLTTGGKGEESYLSSVQHFESRENALRFCGYINSKHKDEKYWKYAEIIELGETYEVSNDGYTTYGLGSVCEDAINESSESKEGKVIELLECILEEIEEINYRAKNNP